MHNASGQVYAAGIIIGSRNGRVCFMTIDNVLAQWGAWLPVFSGAAVLAAGATPDIHPPPTATGRPESRSKAGHWCGSDSLQHIDTSGPYG